MRRDSWTAMEDSLLIDAVKSSIGNKSAAFRSASEKTGRSEGACRERYYKSLLNPESCHYQGIVYTMIGERMKMDDRVVSREGFHVKPVAVRKSLWGKIKSLLGF